jgi:glycosyltransferase 2 family protein
MSKKTMIWISLTISIVILVYVIMGMDWGLFVEAMKGVKIHWLFAALLSSALGLFLRSLRWNTVSGRPLSQISHFWRSAAIGQLGNYIYPMRAGEILRMASLYQFAKVPFGQAATSAVVDRINDGFLLLIFLQVVLSIHSLDVIGTGAVISIVTVFGLLTLGAFIFVAWGRRWAGAVSWFAGRIPAPWDDKLERAYHSALDVAVAFRKPKRLLGMIVLNGFVVAGDILMAVLLILAMGWDLPLEAALTVVVFLWAGSSLPSAPGFIGVYQVACVLSLGLYGIDDSSAVAYSVILQLVSLVAAVVQGSYSAFSYGFSLRLEPSKSRLEEQSTKAGVSQSEQGN